MPTLWKEINQLEVEWKNLIELLSPLLNFNYPAYEDFLLKNRFTYFSGIKILFIPPEYARNNEEPSLGLIRLASFFDLLGASCEIFQLTPKNENDLFNIVKNKRYDFIGISSTYYTLDDDICLCKQLKCFAEGTRIVLGGHGTDMPLKMMEDILNHDIVDCIVKGLGERPLFNYLKFENNCKRIDFRGLNIKNRLTNTKTIYSQNEFNIINLVINPKFYPKHIETFFFNASSHCPMKCVYCSSRNFPGHGVRKLKVDSTIKILKRHLNSLKGIKNIFFYDDDLSCNYEDDNESKKYNGTIWVKQLSCEIKKQEWKCDIYGMFRLDLLTIETINDLINSGFTKYCFGIEHTNHNILKNFRKNINIVKANKNISFIIDNNCEVELFFILFSKWETRETIFQVITDICLYADMGASIIYNWGIQPLFGADIRMLENKYIFYENRYYSREAKIIPDDKLIANWFICLNENKSSFFSFQDELTQAIKHEFFLQTNQNVELFSGGKNINNSSTVINLIRIMSMLLWGAIYCSKYLNGWNLVCFRLYQSIVNIALNKTKMHIHDYNVKKSFENILTGIMVKYHDKI